ncbi:MAG: hypothetical protein L6R35_004931, partial [Caloplaca aegaea]
TIPGNGIEYGKRHHARYPFERAPRTVAVEDRPVPKIEDERGIIVKAPEEITSNALLLIVDIFPTGCSAADNAFKDLTKEQVAGSTVVVMGGGPAGLCAHINTDDHKPKNLLAVDSVQSRLDLAKSLGGEPWNFLMHKEVLDKRINEFTDGRGADVVI